MSLDCPLRKSRDMYIVQEKQKVFEHNARWSCDVCGKAFYTQDYIDQHMERKHSDLVVKNEVWSTLYIIFIARYKTSINSNPLVSL